MTAPETIFASPDMDDGWRWPRASKFPEQGPYENVAYTRTAAIPDPLDDPRVVTLIEAAATILKELRANRYVSDHMPEGSRVALSAALSAITKEPTHEH